MTPPPSPEWLGETIRTVRRFLGNARGSHDWDHTQRVLRLCERIGPPEKADMDALLVAAVLHDIGREHQDRSGGRICHAEKGAVLAAPIVDTLPLHSDQQRNVLHCIRTHRFRGTHLPESIEAKVLFDADKLDAIGAVGVARAYLFAGEIGARLHVPEKDVRDTRPYTEDDTGYREYRVKLAGIRDRMLTATGRAMAEDRHRFMARFFERFLDEYAGAC